MTDYKEGYSSRIRLLAEGLKSRSPGNQVSIVLFLGAGAPRKAGLPLADEMKGRVIEDIFGGKPAPKDVQEGRLEDLMQVLQTSLGYDGYELVARIVREFRQLPPSYLILKDWITEGYVKAVVTTNFDILFDIMNKYAGVKLHFMVDDTSFQTHIPKGYTLVAKLHGCASNPATMRGSGTDVAHSLPECRQRILTACASK